MYVRIAVAQSVVDAVAGFVERGRYKKRATSPPRDAVRSACNVMTIATGRFQKLTPRVSC